MLDLSDYPVIDSHCHPFLPEKETESFEQYLTLSSFFIPERDISNTFLFRQVIRELSRVLNVTGSYKDIIKERQKQYSIY